jgi:hypothetical protein
MKNATTATTAVRETMRSVYGEGWVAYFAVLVDGIAFTVSIASDDLVTASGAHGWTLRQRRDVSRGRCHGDVVASSEPITGSHEDREGVAEGGCGSAGAGVKEGGRRP